MKKPPIPGWTPIRINHPVQIPNLEGTGYSETVPLDLEVWQNEEGEVFFDDEANTQIEKVRARHMGLLTPEAIRKLRERLDLTQDQIAGLLQIGKKSWSRWETGRERPSRSMNILLHALYDNRIDLSYLQMMAHPALTRGPLVSQRPNKTQRSTYRSSPENQGCEEPIVKGG